MIVFMAILAAYLSWCIPQYFFHNLAHKMIKEKKNNMISFGEIKHHALGKDYFYDTEKDPDMAWINVNKKMIITNFLILSLILFFAFGFLFSVIFLCFSCLFSMIDLHIHQRVHLGHQGVIVNFVRRLHSIHHKTWKHNYGIFLGIPLDFFLNTLKSRLDEPQVMDNDNSV